MRPMSHTTNTKSVFIDISFNGRVMACPPNISLAQWLDQQSIAAESIATAVNAEFVPKAKRADTVLQAGDEIMSFAPIVGG